MARSSWQPKISHARFVVGAFTSDQMYTLGGILADANRIRIGRGLNVADLPAKPLKGNRPEPKRTPRQVKPLQHT